MEAIIFYYTGTGNSLWVARTIAGELGDAELLSIADGKKPEDANHSKVVGLVFPVHIWGVPARILRFCNELSALQPDYLWAVAVNAGQVANTLVQLQKVLKSNGLLLRAGFEIPLPSNYIPWGGPGPEEKQSEQFESARKKISEITKCIRNKDIRPVERGPLWQHVLFTPMYRMSFSKVPGMDRQFWADEKCHECGICAKVCPSRNITINGGKPVWNHHCEQCFACLQWCPAEAIQYGKKTPRYERYHHPEIVLKDVLKNRSTLQ